MSNSAIAAARSIAIITITVILPEWELKKPPFAFISVFASECIPNEKLTPRLSSDLIDAR